MQFSCGVDCISLAINVSIYTWSHTSKTNYSSCCVFFQVLNNFDIPDPCSFVELNIESFL